MYGFITMFSRIRKLFIGRYVLTERKKKQMDAMAIEYDNSLIGRIPYVDAYNFYGPEAGGANQAKALGCIRYAVEEVLQWDEETAVKKFDEYMIKEMKLYKLMSYIDFPTEVPFGNARYVLSLLYPDRIRMSQEKLIEDIYRGVLDGNGKQFPREYFAGGIGFKRFCYCIKFLLENYMPFSCVEDIYTYFDSPIGKKFLYKYRLKVPADQFAINMLDVIRYITKDEPDSDLVYHYIQWKREFDETGYANP